MRKSVPPSRRGTSLIEVMFAMLILTIMATGGAAYLYMSAGEISVQRHRRMALHIANARLEVLRATDYEEAAPPTTSYNLYYVDRDSSGWNHYFTDPKETVIVNGRAYPIATTVQYKDLDAGAISYDAVEITVSTLYEYGSDDAVTLQTTYAP